MSRATEETKEQEKDLKKVMPQRINARLREEREKNIVNAKIYHCGVCEKWRREKAKRRMRG